MFYARPGPAQKKSFTHDEHGNESNYSVATLNSTCNIYLRVDEFTKAIEPFNFVPNQPLTNLVYLEGTKEINLTTWIHKDSLSFYRYSIIENDNQALVTDAIPTKIDFVFPPRSSRPGTAIVVLGRYPIQNKKLKIEIYKVSESQKVSTVIFYNKPIKPSQVISKILYPKPKGPVKYPFVLNHIKGGSIKMTDDVGGIFLSIRNADLNFIYHVFLKDFASGKTILISNNWLYDDIEKNPYVLVDASYFQEKGNYELVVVPILSAGPSAKPFNQKATVFRFTVQKETTFTKKELALLLAAILLVTGIIIVLIRALGNKKLADEKQQEEVSQLQLNLVRAQLNPHFMFNALASIQNLMNQNDPDKANRYLGKFARLTRHVLKNQELISLQEEIELLEDYLQMEKLRFGFQYAIIVDDTIEAVNVEIPAMLLQPFVENAVKHGVSGLQHTGEITVRFDKKDKDFVILITDNGRGFNRDTHYTGLGLSLSQSRIALLNKICKNTPLLLNITSEASGTEVKITLTHWL